MNEYKKPQPPHFLLKISSFIPHFILLAVILYNMTHSGNSGEFSGRTEHGSDLRLYVNWVLTSAGFMYAFGHFFIGERVAKSIGWTGGREFQLEVAFANLSFALAALYTEWSHLSLDAYKACAFGYNAFLGGCLLVHIHEWMKTRNFSFNNLIAAPSFSVMNLIYASLLLWS